MHPYRAVPCATTRPVAVSNANTDNRERFHVLIQSYATECNNLRHRLFGVTGAAFGHRQPRSGPANRSTLWGECKGEATARSRLRSLINQSQICRMAQAADNPVPQPQPMRPGRKAGTGNFLPRWRSFNDDDRNQDWPKLSMVLSSIAVYACDANHRAGNRYPLHIEEPRHRSRSDVFGYRQALALGHFAACAEHAD